MDVDEVFRLTKAFSTKEINISFDKSSPSVQYPQFRMSPFNSQNTFFHDRAFWSLYLPTTVPERFVDIWRSYWAQRLMWLLDDTVTFLGPNAFKSSNNHSYINSLEDEKNMHSQAEILVDFLFEWKCSKLKFFECVLELSSQMAEKGFWEYKEVEGINNWLTDLTRIGYLEPEISNFDQRNLCGSIDYKKISYVININFKYLEKRS